MGTRVGLDGGKSRPHRDSIPGPSSWESVTILTELPGPHIKIYLEEIISEIVHCIL